MKKFKKVLGTTLAVTMAIGSIGLVPVEVKAVTSSFNYAEALQKSIMFYEFQKSGDLPENQRNNWRGDSGMSDGADVGLDLTGGWYDAGDHVKFNLPMSYTSTMLAWSVIEDKEAYIESGQYDYILDEIKWANDYFIKCHPSANVYYYQVGDGGADHAFWGAAEILQMERPSYKLDLNNPGASVSAETAASLAAAAIIFKDIDPSYAANCLKHAKELYNFAEITKSDTAYDSVAGPYYKAWSGFYDELSWAGAWLHLATGEETYLTKAEKYVDNWGRENQSATIAYKWAHSWDDVHQGAALLLAKITNKDIYKTVTENHLDYWTTGFNGSRIKYTPKGLAWLDSWGSLRYATTTAFLASVYAEWSGCTPSKVTTYKNFAKAQADYALGSTGRSFVVGYGVDSPTRPHHRTAHGSWVNNLSGEPLTHRHTLVGALVGGPDSNDNYTDSISDYVSNEVACDYNAGFTGLLAKMYKEYGGTPIANLNAIETVGEEIYLEAGINAKDQTNAINFIELKTVVYNKTAWPARVTDKLSYNYFLDLTDVIAQGYTANDMKVTTNYNQSGAKVSQVLPWDEANHIYYVNVDLAGAKIYPGGQSEYKSELQFRIAAPGKWDFTKSFSYTGLGASGSNALVKANNMAVYDQGKLIFGQEPKGSVEVFEPVVQMTAPVNGTAYDFTQSAEAITIKAAASVVESTITKVEFYVNGTKLGESTKAPYEITFNPSGFSTKPNGIETYTITAKATAENGKAKTGEAVQISVKLPVIEAPKVVITAPVADTVFPEGTKTVEVSAVAGVNEGSISKVEFYANGTKFGESTVAVDGVYTSTYKVTGTIPEAGILTPIIFTAKAISDLNQIGEAEAVTVQLQLDVLVPPVADFTLAVSNTNGNQEVVNTLTNNFILKHLGGSDVELSRLKIRYYYTADGAASQNFWCDNASAQMNKDPWYAVYTSKVQGNIVPMSQQKETADCYIEIVFNTTDLLTSDTQLTIATRTAKEDWSNYNQANDFSFGANDKIAIYYDNELIVGMEP